jgi:hypothetical protein
MLFVWTARGSLAKELAGFRVAFIPPGIRQVGAGNKKPRLGVGAGIHENVAVGGTPFTIARTS